MDFGELVPGLQIARDFKKREEMFLAESSDILGYFFLLKRSA